MEVKSVSMPMFGKSIHSNFKEVVDEEKKVSGANYELEYMIQNLSIPQKVRDKLNGKLFASEAGFCPRKNVLNSFLSHQEEMQIAGKFYTAVGDCIENAYADLFKFNGKLVVNSLRIYDNESYVKTFDQKFIFFDDDEKINYSGIVDLIILNDGQLYLLDVKTCGELPEKNSLGYERQVQFYSAVLGINKCGILYQSRNIKSSFTNPLDVRILNVDTSVEKLTEVMTIAYFSKLCIENELLPKRNEKFKKTVQCKHCSFNDFCHNQGSLETYPLIEDDEEELKLWQKSEKLAEKFLENQKVRFERFYNYYLG